MRVPSGIKKELESFVYVLSILAIVDPMRVMQKRGERIKCVAFHVLAECEALCLLTSPNLHVRSLHCSRGYVFLLTKI